jgi:hypothetical protein
MEMTVPKTPAALVTTMLAIAERFRETFGHAKNNLVTIQESVELADVAVVLFPGKTFQGFDYDIVKGTEFVEKTRRSKAVAMFACFARDIEELQLIYVALDLHEVITVH